MIRFAYEREMQTRLSNVYFFLRLWAHLKKPHDNVPMLDQSQDHGKLAHVLRLEELYAKGDATHGEMLEATYVKWPPTGLDIVCPPRGLVRTGDESYYHALHDYQPKQTIQEIEGRLAGGFGEQFRGHIFFNSRKHRRVDWKQYFCENRKHLKSNIAPYTIFSLFGGIPGLLIKWAPEIFPGWEDVSLKTLLLSGGSILALTTSLHHAAHYLKVSWKQFWHLERYGDGTLSHEHAHTLQYKFKFLQGVRFGIRSDVHTPKSGVQENAANNWIKWEGQYCEMQASLHAALAMGYRGWRRMPATPTELMAALWSLEVIVPGDPVKVLGVDPDEWVDARQKFRDQTYRSYFSRTQAGHLKRMLSFLNPEDQVNLFRKVWPALYGGLLNMQGDRYGHVRMQVGEKDLDLCRPPVSMWLRARGNHEDLRESLAQEINNIELGKEYRTADQEPQNNDHYVVQEMKNASRGLQLLTHFVQHDMRKNFFGKRGELDSEVQTRDVVYRLSDFYKTVSYCHDLYRETLKTGSVESARDAVKAFILANDAVAIKEVLELWPNLYPAKITPGQLIKSIVLFCQRSVGPTLTQRDEEILRLHHYIPALQDGLYGLSGQRKEADDMAHAVGASLRKLRRDPEMDRDKYERALTKTVREAFTSLDTKPEMIGALIDVASSPANYGLGKFGISSIGLCYRLDYESGLLPDNVIQGVAARYVGHLTMKDSNIVAEEIKRNFWAREYPRIVKAMRDFDPPSVPFQSLEKAFGVRPVAATVRPHSYSPAA